MRLILTRHGETEENKLHIMQSHLPGTLSKEGIEQGEKLAFRLKDEKFAVIISSDLKRAADTTKIILKYHPNADTTKIILKYHPNVEVLYTKELREGDAGSFTGKKVDEIDWSNRPDDAESTEQLYARAQKLIDDVFEKYKNKTVLFVGHSGINKMITAYITGVPAWIAYQKIQGFGNTSVSIFELKEDKNHIVHLLGDVKHLSS